MIGKKHIRDTFRNTCFQRDRRRCVVCGFVPNPEAWTTYDKGGPAPLNVHHITDRTLLPFGGYVQENGISLCFKCHEYAEIFHITGISHPGYSPEELYAKIGSCYELAYTKSLCLGDALTSERLRQLELIKIREAEIEGLVTRTTWDLACDNLGITDDLLKLYGLGRNAAY